MERQKVKREHLLPNWRGRTPFLLSASFWPSSDGCVRWPAIRAFNNIRTLLRLLHVKTESQPSKETVVTFEKMSPERHQNGHNFSLEGGVCTWCEMPLEHYEDRGKPRCQGVPSPRPWKPRSRTCDTPPHRRSSRFDRRIKDRCRASRHAR